MTVQIQGVDTAGRDTEGLNVDAWHCLIWQWRICLINYCEDKNRQER